MFWVFRKKNETDFQKMVDEKDQGWDENFTRVD